MFRDHLDFLRFLRMLLAPRAYLEIGVHQGASLLIEPAVTCAIGIDPAYDVREISTDGKTALFRMTSDRFFEAEYSSRVKCWPIDLAFIDGMHWAEFVVRDFRNIEALCQRNAVVVIHDIFPRNAAQAARIQPSGDWMGDVFKAVLALMRFRPDLQVINVADIPPSGLTVIHNVDPESRILTDRYEEIVEFMERLDYELDFTSLMATTLVNSDSEAFCKALQQLAALRAVRPISTSGLA